MLVFGLTYNIPSGQIVATSHQFSPHKVAFWKGISLISKKSLLVKYYSIWSDSIGGERIFLYIISPLDATAPALKDLLKDEFAAGLHALEPIIWRDDFCWVELRPEKLR